MTTLNKEIYTHVGIKKHETILMTDTAVKNWETAKNIGYGTLLIIRDINGFVSFKGNADLIEEIKEIDIKKETHIARQKQLEKEYEKSFMANKSQKTKWTRDKLKYLSDDEIQFFIEEAKLKLQDVILKNKVGEKFVNEYGMCLLRKYFNCPYN